MGDIVDIFAKTKPAPSVPKKGDCGPRLPIGKEALLYELLAGGAIAVTVDATRPGVEVPEALESRTNLVVALSWEHSSSDLKVNPWGIRCIIELDGSRYQAAIPWCAVYQIGPVLWTDEVPNAANP
jgi:hypothetical protein